MRLPMIRVSFGVDVDVIRAVAWLYNRIFALLLSVVRDGLECVVYVE